MPLQARISCDKKRLGRFSSFFGWTQQPSLIAGFGGGGHGWPQAEPRTFGISNFYDIFVKNAFGNYRDIIRRVTFILSWEIG